MSKWTLGLAMLALCAVPFAHAEELKIGTVDMQKALQSVDAGKKAKAQLEKEFNAKKKDLQNEEANLRKITEDFKKQQMVMNDDARAKKQGEIQERIMKYQEATQKSQMEIQQKEHELTEPILNKLRGDDHRTGQEQRLFHVLERNENMVLYSPEKDDLTDDVITAYNKKNSG